jgi:hypothetical protein
MKHKQFFEDRSGKLVHQLPEDVTIAYNFHFGSSRDHWKGLIKDQNSVEVLHHSFNDGIPKHEP